MSWIPDRINRPLAGKEKENAQAFIDEHSACLNKYRRESMAIREFAPSAMISYRIGSSSFALHLYIRCDTCKKERCIDDPECY
jgi:hypothetical protein